MQLPKPHEAEIQKQVMQYLWAIGAFAIRINSGAFAGEHNGKRRFVRFNSEPGTSDILAILPNGRFAAFEVKRPGWKRPSGEREEKQAAFLAEVRKRGGVAAFVTGVDDVVRELEG